MPLHKQAKNTFSILKKKLCTVVKTFFSLTFSNPNPMKNQFSAHKTHSHTHTHIYTSPRSNTHTRTHAHTHTHTHAHTDTDTQTDTHTHTNPGLYPRDWNMR